MDYRTLPGLDRKVSLVGAGCWTIGGPAVNDGKPVGWGDVDPDMAFEGLLRARERGVTLFDTADVYGMGRSERLVGRMLRATGGREDIVISTKVGYFAGTSRHPYLPRQIDHQFATSLDNLGTDYVDLYHLHSGDFGKRDAYLRPAIVTVQRLREQGLIRAVAMRAPHRFAAEWAEQPDHPHHAEARRFLELFRAVRPNVLTLRHSLMMAPYALGETDVFSFAAAEGVGVLVKQVLAQGLLLGTYRSDGFGPGDHRSRKPLDPGLLVLVKEAVEQMRERFGPRRRDLARVAIQYAVHASPDAVALVGFRNASQISTTLANATDPLSDQDVDALRAVMAPVHERMKALQFNTSTR
ncbi:aldo/keto reductase [Streptomyces sp. NPDC015125]|uniref:aldo/keto reductase n=1 Tax=Streptomyces sp. NPDC015125 TaxID=3364938 RepID=UPI0036FCAA07